ncbi:hypothetical protein [Enterococcus faecium]|uniref:PglD-related sugar-binding protein n=1 Tax=Enterococcus faecium TaxID=1352 RepID=UPI00211E1279|nr:hypothetical protein [Enterococcus faecium]
MKAIIVGAGGFGKEIAFLLQSVSRYELAGFVDDSLKMQNQELLEKPILGTIDSLIAVAYTRLRAHETDSYFVSRQQLEKKNLSW